MTLRDMGSGVRACLTAIGCAMCLASTAALAASPQKPIRFIVPFGPGGATDIVARAVAQRLTEAWGQTVVIDNRGGAGGIVGTELVARATPDGHTLLLATTSNATQVALQSKLPFDLLKDFAPVTQLIDAPFVLTANPKVAPGSLKELIAAAKAKPGSLNYGTVGGFNLLMMELVKSMSGTDITAVPYKGVGPALIDLTAGRIHLMLFSVGVAQPYLKDGRLRAVAVTTARRVALLPAVPTVAETLPGYDMTAWYGVLAPGRTPRPVVEKLHAEIVRILKTHEIQESFGQQGFITVGSTPAAFAAQLSGSIVKFRRIVQDAKVQVE